MDKKSEKKLIQDFKGMKMRFQNPTEDYEKNIRLMLSDLMDAYDMDNHHINCVAIKSYQEVRTVILQELDSPRSKRDKKQVQRCLIILDAYMKTFYYQACKYYD